MNEKSTCWIYTVYECLKTNTHPSVCWAIVPFFCCLLSFVFLFSFCFLLSRGWEVSEWSSPPPSSFSYTFTVGSRAQPENIWPQKTYSSLATCTLFSPHPVTREVQPFPSPPLLWVGREEEKSSDVALLTTKHNGTSRDFSICWALTISFHRANQILVTLFKY